jgi:hypothetical protein
MREYLIGGTIVSIDRDVFVVEKGDRIYTVGARGGVGLLVVGHDKE